MSIPLWGAILGILGLLTLTMLVRCVQAASYDEGYQHGREDAGAGALSARDAVAADALMLGIERTDTWLGLHREVRVIDYVDRITLEYTDHDGDRVIKEVSGETLLDALIAAAHSAPEVP
jgi:hypothetical protein